MIDQWLEKAYSGKLLAERDLRRVAQMAVDLLVEEPNVVTVCAPVTLVGDTHGMFEDFLNMINNVAGRPPQTRYCFLGNYVDRGYQSCEEF